VINCSKVLKKVQLLLNEAGDQNMLLPGVTHRLVETLEVGVYLVSLKVMHFGTMNFCCITEHYMVSMIQPTAYFLIIKPTRCTNFSNLFLE